jgi:starvation-inducible DNA-binding protein
MPSPKFTVPGLSPDKASRVIEALQDRLVALIDLQLTLKHIHWNVVGPTFIGVHEMLDPQVDAVRMMVDDAAERIATLGGEPNGLPGNLVSSRKWDDYDLGRALVEEHLGALDVVYGGLIGSHRELIDELEDLDMVTQDMVIEQTERLEQFQWFVRAHLENGGGQLSTAGATHEREAASRARSAVVGSSAASTKAKSPAAAGNARRKAGTRR